MNGTDYARGLRAIADWYEAHPDIPVPHTDEVGIYGVKETKEEAARIAEALKPCQKAWDGEFFRLKREFDGLILSFVFMRSAVCTARVVGHRVIPAEPEHVVEVVEWDCPDSLLAGREEVTT